MGCNIEDKKYFKVKDNISSNANSINLININSKIKRRVF